MRRHSGAASARIATTAGITALLFIRVANAHEHHDDKIPEGEGVSPDPIVRRIVHTTWNSTV